MKSFRHYDKPLDEQTNDILDCISLVERSLLMDPIVCRCLISMFKNQPMLLHRLLKDYVTVLEALEHTMEHLMHPYFLELLSTFCTCNGEAIADNQRYICERFLPLLDEHGFHTMHDSASDDILVRYGSRSEYQSLKSLIAGMNANGDKVKNDKDDAWFFNIEKPVNSADVVKETGGLGLRNRPNSLRHAREKRITMHHNMMLLGKTMDFTDMPVYVLLEYQVNLCASLVSCRNSEARREVEDRLGLTVAQSSMGTNDASLPASLRSAFARYVLASGVDIQPRYEQPRLRYARLWSEVGSNMAQESIKLGHRASQFELFNPHMQNSIDVKLLIENHVMQHPMQVICQDGLNNLTLTILDILSKMISFQELAGSYLSRILPGLLDLLDGRNDQIIGTMSNKYRKIITFGNDGSCDISKIYPKARYLVYNFKSLETKQNSGSPHITVNKEEVLSSKGILRTNNFENVQELDIEWELYDIVLVKLQGNIDSILAADGWIPFRDKAELNAGSGYRSNLETQRRACSGGYTSMKTVLQIKAKICFILQQLLDRRLDAKMTSILDATKPLVEGPEGEVLAPKFEPTPLLIEEQRLAPILLDLTMYENKTLIHKAFNLLFGFYSSQKRLRKAVQSIMILNAPAKIEVFKKINSQVRSLLHHIENGYLTNEKNANSVIDHIRVLKTMCKNTPPPQQKKSVGKIARLRGDSVESYSGAQPVKQNSQDENLFKANQYQKAFRSRGFAHSEWEQNLMGVEGSILKSAEMDQIREFFLTQEQQSMMRHIGIHA